MQNIQVLMNRGEWVQGCYTETLRYNNLHWIWNGKNHFTVNPETVGQYTGLADKNGTKIFEGDISKVQLQVPYLPSQPKTISAVGVVEFNTEKSSYYVVSTSGEEYALCFIEEVIGNIHDNPELLESEVEGE